MPKIVMAKDVRHLRAGQVLDMSEIDAKVYTLLGLANYYTPAPVKKPAPAKPVARGAQQKPTEAASAADTVTGIPAAASADPDEPVNSTVGDITVEALPDVPSKRQYRRRDLTAE